MCSLVTSRVVNSIEPDQLASPNLADLASDPDISKESIVRVKIQILYVYSAHLQFNALAKDQLHSISRADSYFDTLHF